MFFNVKSIKTFEKSINLVKKAIILIFRLTKNEKSKVKNRRFFAKNAT